MRMKKTRVETLNFCNRTVTKDSEGVTTETFGASFTLTGERWATGGNRAIETYGERINNMLSIKIRDKYTVSTTNGVITFSFGSNKTLKVGDGVCIYGSTPDYQIVGFTAYKPLRIEVEKI